MSLIKEMSKGFIKENPVFIMALGLCPALAVSTSIENAIGMSLATTFVLLCSNILISLLKNFIPTKVRIPCFIVVIASFVTIVDMVMHAYTPMIHRNLGIFIPLIVVNCMILGRAEAFASKSSLLKSIFDGLGMGIGFGLALILVAFFRELLGAGQLLGFRVMPENFQPVLAAILAPGAFFTLGLLMSAINLFKKKEDQ